MNSVSSCTLQLNFRPSVPIVSLNRCGYNAVMRKIEQTYAIFAIDDEDWVSKSPPDARLSSFRVVSSLRLPNTWFILRNYNYVYMVYDTSAGAHWYTKNNSRVRLPGCYRYN